MLAILFISFTVISCEKEEEETINEAEVLIEYLESTASPYGKYFINTDMPALKLADHVKAQMATGNVYLIDVRKAGDWAAGHIEGAVNMAAGDVLSHLEETDLSAYGEIAIVCYTGQEAGWVTTLCRIAGYDNVYALKWGMCGWNADFADYWNNNILNAGVGHFDKTAVDKGAEGELPSLNTGFEVGQDILDARLDAICEEGFGETAIVAQMVLDNKADYYIINYWPLAEYNDPGHISGAIQYTPKESIALNADLKTLPTDKTIVAYCYSGQESAQLVTYLRLIGYDAKSLKYGTNGLIYDQMTKAKWSETQIAGYEYKTE